MVNVFTINNFPLPATPPGYFVPDAAGRTVPSGHTSWKVTINTTGLASGQVLATLVVQYHYTGVVLFPGNVIDAGHVTNTDGSVTIIPGTNSFTGWIDDCGPDTFNTTHPDKLGATVFAAFFGCDLNRIPNAYPDHARILVLSSPGYANITSATFDLT